MKKTQLSPEIWIAAGLKQLAVHGPSALRAEPLSRYLKTSKGSFYWHFKDVPDFQAAVLDQWKASCLKALGDDKTSAGSTTEHLIRFGQTVQKDSAGPAVRAWSQTETKAKRSLKEVDTARMERLTALLKEFKLTNPEFTQAAYGALIGLKQTHLSDADGLVAYAALVDVVRTSV